jgi:dipeptidyl aminopeptidase/acylaminoacyl peptidase
MRRNKFLRRNFRVIPFVAAIAIAAAATSVFAQFVAPTSNLVIEGVPAIPAELAKKVEAYTEFKPSSVIAWHPKGEGVLTRSRLNDTNQAHWVKTPGAKPEPLTDFGDAVTNASFQPRKAEFILFERGNGGDEVFRIYRLDLSTKTVTPISPEGERASTPAWNRRGNRIVFTTSTIDSKKRVEKNDDSAERTATTKVYIADPLKPETAKVVSTFEGGRFFNFRFTPDQKQLLYSEYISANESHLWMMDIASGEKKRITPEPKTGAAPVAYGGNVRFTRDGKSIYTTSDRDSEFRRLVRIDLVSGKETVLTEHLKFDVDDFAISYKANRIALTTNEEGSSVLRFLDLTTSKELPRPALLSGEISGLRWRSAIAEESDEEDNGEAKDSNVDLAFNLTSARSAGEVYSMNVGTTKLTRWTNGASPNLNALEFVDPKIIRWKSFDGLAISGYLYQPDAKKFAGKRPVIINIHGGPEAQARPGFIGRNNYMVNELGLAVIYPNVRGSSGFGKTFLALDNGKKREDSVKDIGALLDWLKDQPDLDADKVLVMGGSYGGYMALAVSTNYADRIAGAIDSVGISNFVTFLNNTESYRRDLRRVEYGDERDPDMRKFLESISPLTNASKIRKPLFVVQGKNDPRVPYTEALQIVEKTKAQKVPVWFLMANDEGHGFAKKSNQDFLFYAQIKFMEKTLLQ